MGRLVIRSMKVTDLNQVMTIERVSFQSPWSKNTFQTEIQKNPKAYYLVGLQGEYLVAYLGSWFFLTDAHLTTIAVHPDSRRRGTATSLLEYFLVQALLQGIKRISLEVRGSNIKAQRLYRSLGFIQIGIREKYYHNNNEDALIMGLEIH